jgi:DNA modification methylase
MTAKVLVGDCREVLLTLEANSIDACVTDPPYGLEFMGKEWDRLWVEHGDGQQGRINGKGGMDTWGKTPQYKGGLAAQAWHETWAREVYRVLKPGAHLLAFSGTRTSHRMVCAIEDAGFEIRDCLMWLYGSGFPKSLDVSKAMDKAARAEREVVGKAVYGDGHIQNSVESMGYQGNEPGADTRVVTAPATDLARQWDGWGTALKPSYEPIILARKPLAGTVAANVTQYGTGALNIDGCRIDGDIPETQGELTSGGIMAGSVPGARREPFHPNTLGRWPANLLLSHHLDCREVGTRRVKASGFERSRPPRQTGMIYGDHADTPFSGHADADGYETVAAWECHPDCAARLLDEMSGERGGDGGGYRLRSRVASTDLGIVNDDNWRPKPVTQVNYGDTGGASRFFYTSKSSRAERNKGLAGMPEQRGPVMSDRCVNCGKGRMDGRRDGPCCDEPEYESTPARGNVANHHPTVKPVDLMQWLVRLITPKGGTVLDPFLGSGSTGIAADREGFHFIGIEQDAEYAEIARKRIVGDCPLFTTLAAD